MPFGAFLFLLALVMDLVKIYYNNYAVCLVLYKKLSVSYNFFVSYCIILRDLL